MLVLFEKIFPPACIFSDFTYTQKKSQVHIYLHLHAYCLLIKQSVQEYTYVVHMDLKKPCKLCKQLFRTEDAKKHIIKGCKKAYYKRLQKRMHRQCQRYNFVLLFKHPQIWKFEMAVVEHVSKQFKFYLTSPFGKLPRLNCKNRRGFAQIWCSFMPIRQMNTYISNNLGVLKF